MNTVAIFSSASDNWSTPKEVYQDLDEEFSFTDDPCPLGATDGLDRSWGKSVFVNPPYSDIGRFVQWGLSEIRKGHSRVVVFLLPARTDSWWFHQLCLPEAKEIRFIRGRLRFGNASNSAPFGSMVVVFRG